MSRPIQVDIVPSHIYLSEKDQKTLFGVGHAMTILVEHSHPGQIVYQDTVAVKGKNDEQIDLHILGPNWERTHIEVTPTEAKMLGLRIVQAKSGHLENAQSCTLIGPHGIVELDFGLIVPRPHLMCSVKDAETLHVINGQTVTVELSGTQQKISDVIVRVHPMFRLRLEIHQDFARDFWLTRGTHATILH